MSAPLVFATGEEAFSTATRKAVHGHNDWLVWKTKDGTYRIARMPDADVLESAMKECVVNPDTKKPIAVMIARNTGTALSASGVWKVWLSNMRKGYWS